MTQGIEKRNIFGAMTRFFKQPDAKPVMEDKEQVDKTYKEYRTRIFYSCFIGYVMFYLCKKNIAAALPAMSQELHYTNTELGILGSSLYFTYAIGKFVNGVMADSSDVRKFLPFALIMSAIVNICFALSFCFITPGQFTFFGLPSATILLWVLAFFWGLNGWFQSMGFPAIAKSLTFWYSNSERGTKWALWSTSHQVGTFISVLLSGFIIAQFGWQAAFFIPAIFAILVSVWLLDRLRDKPTSLGLPDVEDYREPYQSECGEEKPKNPDDDMTYGQIFVKHILKNKTLWALAVAYIFVYVIRFGTEDWIIKYLVEFKQNSLQLASLKLSSLPLFGIAGTICAGLFSDKIFKGLRAPINVIYLLGVVLCMAGLFFNGTGENLIDTSFKALSHKNLTDVIGMNGSSIVDFILIGMTGFFTYGPQMLIGGLCAIESSSKKVASAATGFTGTFGYIGAVISGIGTGLVVDKFGWQGALGFWALSALICTVICLPMCFPKKKVCEVKN